MTKRPRLEHYVDEALLGLKDFQKATVDTVYQQIYGNGQRCMLVADEVGLGKTIVAKGIIARRILERLQEKKRSPLRVTYICSNQVIARENLRKLNLFPSTVAMKKPVSRLAFLAEVEPEPEGEGVVRQHLLELNSLTPSTSFEVQRSAGLKKERAIIYALLCHDPDMNKHRRGLQWLLRGSVEKMRDYQNYLERKRKATYRDDLPNRFLKVIKKEKIPKSETMIYSKLGSSRVCSLYQAVLEFAKQLHSRRGSRREKQMHRGCLRLVHQLRRLLIHCCLRYVNADLYILDEFQRFRNIVDINNQEEEATIARDVMFAKRDSRVLLLSATPFKAFTNHDDLDRGEDHYQDFRKVLEFLLRDRSDCLNSYDQHRQGLYKQLLTLQKGEIDLNPEHRSRVEEILRSVMCRTERNSVADDPAVMVEDQWRDPVKLSLGDIENFRQTDQIVQSMNRLKLNAGKPTEYCKSALYPFSYLDRYKIKESLSQHKHDPEIASCLEATKGAWLNLESVDRYSLNLENGQDSAGPTHARLQLLIEKAIGERGAELLWVSPSLPYYPLEGSFQGMETFSKTLLFSAWVMVPRVISTLLSYEVERRTVGNEATRESMEKQSRTYFQQPRHPSPQMRFATTGKGVNAQQRNMSNFCLLYPSPFLAQVVDPVQNVSEGFTLAELRKRTTERIRAAIDRADLDQYTTKGGDGERWYWAAPLLLDRLEMAVDDPVETWFESESPKKYPWERKTYFQDASDESRGKESHLAHLRDCFHDPASAGLGRPPADLAEVLAELALGSPAVLALRSLGRLFPDQKGERLMVGAFDVADQFVNLFNKPESIAAVRLRTPHDSYWRKVSNYCANGCLQAVLDEYFHLLREQNIDFDEAVTRLASSVTLNTASINVDDLDSFLAGKPRRLRCHYAVEFGSQRIETEQGGQRATGLREVFNSPFRPFVLATTSIGQEGLDFHSYCRRIVHWNLPGNPIDLEQREGRINRYKGLVIRQFLAKKYRQRLTKLSGDVWSHLFKLASVQERQAQGKCELVPYWHVETDAIKIERVIPFYPYSSDQAQLRKILKTLAIYRLAFGQPRQAELIEHLLARDFEPDEMKEIVKSLMVDLSPINYSANSSS